ncbi:MAG: MFS transporter [Oscillospiraceae bacterium]|jgi:Na+/melibiose symporter-like transporter|nr:MFS transporter [Oscillospiraceae bacterium]
MPKLSPELKAQIRGAARHPLVWWRGAGLPEEAIRPWEGGIQFFAELLKGFMSGFTSMKDRLFVGMGEGKIPPNLKSVHDVIRITWDGLNDPPVGMYMDRKRFGEKIHRWVMRFNATFSPVFILVQCLDLGLTPVRRVILWTAITMFADVMSTANAVSETKIWAGISPHSKQRGALQMWRTLGDNVGALVTGLPIVMMGFAGTLGWDLSDYKIMAVGAAITAPLTIFSRWLPSFAKQRVDFTVKVGAEGEEAGQGKPEEKLTLRESFAIVKHNSWFMMCLVIDFIRLLVPGTDRMLIYRFLVPRKRVFGKDIDGLLIKTLFRDIAFGWPALALLPLAQKAVERFGGPVQFIRAHSIINGVTQAITFATGYTSWPRLVALWALEGVREVMNKWSAVPHTMIRYEMFDYVEWKTGYRSEGVTQSVDGLLKKLLKDNIGSVIGNLVTQWTGYKGWDVPLAEQPERFMKALWPLLHAGPVFGEIVALVAILRFKYPHDPKEVEADLIERRALAQKLRAEVESQA